MATYTFSISDMPDGSVEVTGAVTDKEGGPSTTAGHIAQSNMVFLTELLQRLQGGHPIEPNRTLQ